MSGPVVVVGAGITGLSAAYQLRLDGAEVIVLEASDRVGGVVAGSTVGGVFVESGPDGFLARRAEMADLCRQLGLGADLVAPAVSRAFIWADGALRPIPAPSVLGVPLDADSVAVSGLVSDEAVEELRAGLDQPAPPLIGDAAVGEALRPRLGDEVFERLVDPLLGGINGGSADAMSLAAGASRLHEALCRGGPLGEALRTDTDEAEAGPVMKAGTGRCSPPPGWRGTDEAGAGPVMMGVRGGTTRVTAALAAALGPSIRTAAPVTAVERTQSGWSLATPDGPVEADRVILTAPAPVTASLLEPHCPEAAEILGAVEYSDVVLVTFVAQAERIAHQLDGSGFLAPRDQGLLMTACSWSSSKWEHYRGGGRVVLRVSAGRTDDRRWLGMDRPELVAALADELAVTVGLDGYDAVRVTPWPQSLPQYRPGHLDRMDKLDRHLADTAPGLVATGAAHRGLGLPACVAQGRAAAASLR